jgi:hypothetical protein
MTAEGWLLLLEEQHDNACWLVLNPAGSMCGLANMHLLRQSSTLPDTQNQFEPTNKGKLCILGCRFQRCRIQRHRD